MDMERAEVLVSETDYRKEAKRLSMKYGLVHDDITLANHLAVAKRTSDLIYQKDYKENIMGLSSKADLNGVPVYRDAKELKSKVSESAYRKEALKVLKKNNYQAYNEEERARQVIPIN
jgi:tRNA G18 (ribose-2'-O)-methylase SpoU